MNMKRKYPHYTNNNWLPLKWDIIKKHKFHTQSERGDKSAEGKHHFLLLRGLATCLGESVATPALKLNLPLLGVCCPFRDGLAKLREVFGVWNPPNPPATFPWLLPNMGVAVGWFEDRFELPPPVKLICPSPVAAAGVKLNPF